jgi:ABC-type nickel/cobalt efflux system permease component RcnA
MLAAISLGQVLFGMLLIVAFSLGLAGVLVAIGLALVLGRRLSGRAGANRVLLSPSAARFARALPVLSAIAVTLAGAAITYQAWNQPGL